MPILWRYLLAQYFKVLMLCTLSFIVILLTTRLDDIAHFATLGAEGLYVLWFALYQIPYILPIALPISCLISAILLFQRLSGTHEITALRATGFSLPEILLPLLLAAAPLSLVNFYIVSEMATDSHLKTGLLKNELRSVNPLLLLHNKHLLRLKGIYFDILGNSKLGDYASDTIFAIPNKKNERLNLMISKGMQVTPLAFTQDGVTLITSLESNSKQEPIEADKGKIETFDSVMIENIGKSITSIEDFSQILQKKVWKVNNDHLQMPLLLVKLHDDQLALNAAKDNDKPYAEIKILKRTINRIYSEIVRRISTGLAVLSFTLMGAVFGISISRNRSNTGLIFVIAMAAFYLTSYFAAKAVDQFLVLATIIYMAPHLLMFMGSAWTIRRLTKGIE